MSITFPVAAVEVSTERLRTESPASGLKRLLSTDKEPEAMGSNAQGALVRTTGNGFIQAAYRAYDQHLPLILSPDDVWLCIAQGFAMHVNENAEALRRHFVAHEGKAQIWIDRDNFVKGSPTNDWPGAFDEFAAKIGEHIGKKKDLLVSDFSTTGTIEKAASNIVLMDAMKSFFDYGMRTCCGIPSITLLGEVKDWESIRTRAGVLKEYDCDWWLDALLPVLDQFVEASRGRADKAFWECFVKDSGGSGGPYVTGAINVFFPYLLGLRRVRKNDAMARWKEGLGRWAAGPSLGDFPIGLSKVPFDWKYFAERFKMELLGGFVGCAQEESGALRPAIGWAVRDEPPQQG